MLCLKVFGHGLAVQPPQLHASTRGFQTALRHHANALSRSAAISRCGRLVVSAARLQAGVAVSVRFFPFRIARVSLALVQTGLWPRFAESGRAMSRFPTALPTLYLPAALGRLGLALTVCISLLQTPVSTFHDHADFESEAALSARSPGVMRERPVPPPRATGISFCLGN